MNKHMEAVRRKWNDFHLSAWALGVGSAFVIVLVIAVLFAYALPSEWSITKKARSVLPLPMVSVAGHPTASYREVGNNLSAVQRFYEAQDFASLGMRVDFTTSDGKKRLKIREREIINKMVEDEAMRILARRENIRISEAEASAAVARELEKIGGSEQNVKEKLSRLYGWNLAQFQDKVVLPSLYEEALVSVFDTKYADSSQAQEKIEKAAQNLALGRTFSDTAMEYSEGRTAKSGGDMGWFAYPDLIEPLQKAAQSQEVGVPGAILESGLGFHILLVNERKKEGDAERVRVSQIFVKKKTFGEWLAMEMSNMSIRVLAPEYEWNKSDARVEFSDPKLREFETELLKKSEGDASLIF